MKQFCLMAILLLGCAEGSIEPCFSSDRQLNASSEVGNGICSRPGSKTKAMKDVDTGLRSSWSSSRPCPDDYVEIKFSLGDDGKIFEPEVIHPCKDYQYNAECLEAICGLSPVAATLSNTTAELQHRNIRFGNQNDPDCFEPAFNGADVREYQAEHPQPKNTEPTFVLVHKIPIMVLKRYPDYFSAADILSANNLIKIKIDAADATPGYVRRIANLYAYWAQLFKDKDVTKEQILHRTEGDRLDTHAQ